MTMKNFWQEISARKKVAITAVAALVLALIMSVILTQCGTNNNNDPIDSNPTQSVTGSEQPTTPTQTPNGESSEQPGDKTDPNGDKTGENDGDKTGENDGDKPGDNSGEDSNPGDINKVTVGTVKNLKGTVDGTTVTLTWDKVEGSNISYEVYMKDGNGVYKLLKTVVKNNSTTINTGIEAGHTYTFKVIAVTTTVVDGKNMTVKGNASNEVTVTIPAGSNPGTDTKPGVTTTVGKVNNLKYTVDGTTVTLTWDKVEGSNISYEVYMKDGEGAYKLVTTVKNNSVGINTGIEAGHTYTFKVIAVTTAVVDGKTTTVKGEASNEVTVTIPKGDDGNTGETDKVTVGKVSNLKGTVDGTTITLTWDKVEGSNISYEVYMKEDGGTYSLVQTVKTNSATISTGIKAGHSYTFKVIAFTTTVVDGKTTTVKGEESSEVKVVVSLATASSIKTTPGTTSVKITWDKVEGATGYEIVITKTNGTVVKTVKTTSTSITITGLSSNTEYTVKIRTYVTIDANSVYGPYSSEVKFKTLSNTSSNDNNGDDKKPGGNDQTGDEDDKKPGGDEQDGDDDDKKPGGDDDTPGGEDDNKPGGDEQDGDDDDKKPGGDDDTPGGDDDKKPGGDEQDGDDDDKKPGGDDQTPGGEDDKKPGGDDQTPGGEDDKKPGGEDDKKPGGNDQSNDNKPGGEVQVPGGQEQPGADEGYTPGSEQQTPGGQEQPGADEGYTPGGEQQTPGGQEQPGGDGQQNPGGEGQQNPGGEEHQNPGGTEEVPAAPAVPPIEQAPAAPPVEQAPVAPPVEQAPVEEAQTPTGEVQKEDPQGEEHHEEKEEVKTEE